MRRIRVEEAWELLLAIDPPRGVVLERGQQWFDFMGGLGAGLVMDEHGREVRVYTLAEVRALGGAK